MNSDFGKKKKNTRAKREGANLFSTLHALDTNREATHASLLLSAVADAAAAAAGLLPRRVVVEQQQQEQANGK